MLNIVSIDDFKNRKLNKDILDAAGNPVTLEFIFTKYGECHSRLAAKILYAFFTTCKDADIPCLDVSISFCSKHFKCRSTQFVNAIYSLRACGVFKAKVGKRVIKMELNYAECEQRVRAWWENCKYDYKG